MIRFFKGQKLAAINSKSAIKYLGYALGEILLVVVGILIALAINNNNENRKQGNQLNSILKSVSYDLALDTVLVGRAIKYYEDREVVADKIASGQMTAEDYKKCILCGTLTTSYFPISLNDKGYEQLRFFVEGTKEKDSLAVDIVQFYKAYTKIINEFNDHVKTNSFETLKLWRDTKPNFAEVMANPFDPKNIEFVTSSENYRNNVAYYNIIACKNLKSILEQYQVNAKGILEQLEKRAVNQK